MQKPLPPLTHIYGAHIIDGNSTAKAKQLVRLLHTEFLHKVWAVSPAVAATHGVALRGHLLLVAQVTSHLLILLGSKLDIFTTSLKHMLLFPFRDAGTCATVVSAAVPLQDEEWDMHLPGDTHCFLLSSVTGQKKAFRSQSIMFIHAPQISQISLLPAEAAKPFSMLALLSPLTYSYQLQGSTKSYRQHGDRHLDKQAVFSFRWHRKKTRLLANEVEERPKTVTPKKTAKPARNLGLYFTCLSFGLHLVF